MGIDSMMRLTDEEVHAIRCALVLSAEKYRENAVYISTRDELQKPVRDSIHDQFYRQARECRALLEKLDNSGGVVLLPEE